jgi:hypothetical protein
MNLPLIAFFQGDLMARLADPEKTLSLKLTIVGSSFGCAKTIGRLRRPIVVSADAIG